MNKIKNLTRPYFTKEVIPEYYVDALMNQTSKMTPEEVTGLTRTEILAKYGPPLEAEQTPKKKLWVYYYPKLHIFFDAKDIAEWCYWE